MARLVDVFTVSDELEKCKTGLSPLQVAYQELDVHHIPIVVDDLLLVFDSVLRNDNPTFMIMEMNLDNNDYLNRQCKREPPSKAEFQEFVNKYKQFTEPELIKALTISYKDVTSQMSVMVPCIGCRRSAESAYADVVAHGYHAYYPFCVDEDGSVHLSHVNLDMKSLFYLFHHPSNEMRNLLASFSKFSAAKKGKRCNVHSLESHRAHSISSWVEVWDYMSVECQAEIALINREHFEETLEGYLKKHRFCSECKAKVIKAYGVLTLAVNPSNEQGYSMELFSGITYNSKEYEFQLESNTEYVSRLISKAVPELSGTSSEQERHAKTMDTAQEEVLTCFGICLFERLHRVHQRFKEEERAWEIVMCVVVQSLRRNFDLALHDKSGMASLEWLAEEKKKQDAKKQKKSLKKQKRKNKKQEQTEEASEDKEACEDITDENGDPVSQTSVPEQSSPGKSSEEGCKHDESEGKSKTDSGGTSQKKCSGENFRDHGYSSDNKSGKTTPLASEPTCLDGFFNRAQDSCGTGKKEGKAKQKEESKETSKPVESILESKNEGAKQAILLSETPEQNNNLKGKEQTVETITQSASDNNGVEVSKKKKKKSNLILPRVIFKPLPPVEIVFPIPYRTLEEQLEDSELADEPIVLPEEYVKLFRDPKWQKRRARGRKVLVRKFDNCINILKGIVPESPPQDPNSKPAELETKPPVEATPVPEAKATVNESRMPDKPEPSAGHKSESLGRAGGKENKKSKGARNTKAKQTQALRRYKGKNRH